MVCTQQINIDPSANQVPELYAGNSGFPQQLPRAGPRISGHLVVLGRRRRRPELHPRGPGPAARRGHRVQRRPLTYTSVPAGSAPTRSATSPATATAARHEQTFTVDVMVPAAPACDDADRRSSVRTGARRSPVPVTPPGLRSSRPELQDHRPARLGTLDPPADGRASSGPTRRAARRANDSSLPRRRTSSGTGDVGHPGRPSDRRPPTRPRHARQLRVPRGPCRQGRVSSPPCSGTTTATTSATRSSPSPPTARSPAAGGTLVYTPGHRLSGPDQFNFKATDGHGGESAPATRHSMSWPRRRRLVRRRRRSRCARTASARSSSAVRARPAARSPTSSTPRRRRAARSAARQPQAVHRRPRSQGDASSRGTRTATSAATARPQTQAMTIDGDANVAPTCPATRLVRRRPGVSSVRSSRRAATTSSTR